MNKYFTTLFAALTLLAACKSEQKSGTENPTDSVATTTTNDSSNLKIDADVEASFSDIKHFATYSEDFQLLVASLDGVFRGINLSMTKDEVKTLEKDVDAPLLKETADQLTYKVSLGDNETATILYKFKDGKTDGINVEVRVNSIEAYEALNAELIDYYGKKFGKMEFENGQEKWTISPTHKLMVHDLMKNKNDFYILIEVK
jgi:hypothetical protein